MAYNGIMKIVPLQLETMLPFPNGDQYWFTADTHLGHGNIIKYCKRPFSSVQEMDDTIISNINAKVQENHFLYVIGDFAIWYNDRGLDTHEIFAEYRKRIKCKNMFLVMGNHDPHFADYSPKKELYEVFTKVAPIMRLKIDGVRLYLHHYACRVWPHSHRQFHRASGLPTPSWHLYGHSHGGLPDDPHSLSFDVGVDCHGFQPLNLNEVAGVMSSKQWIDYLAEKDEPTED